MGTPSDPDEPEYEPGNECAVCVEELFDGKTPEFVRAKFEGLVPYPGEDPPPEMPEFILEQDAVDHCKWIADFWDNGNLWVVSWHINDPDPEWNSRLTLAITGVPLFWGKSDDTCVAGFENEYNGEVGFWTKGGTGCVTWGPEIE